MHVRAFPLFPTRLVAVNFDGVDGLNHDLCELFAGGEFSAGFDMHLVKPVSAEVFMTVLAAAS